MASAGTLLSDLDGNGGGEDGDYVQKILSDMNIPTGGGMRPAPPPMQAHAPPPQQGYQQEPNSLQHIVADNRIPTAHMIGNEHPTSADFAAAMSGMPGGQRGHGVADMAGSVGTVGPTMQGTMPGFDSAYATPSKNMYGTIVSEIKIPAMVAILFFIFSLPPIRVLVAHYMPSLIRPTGEFHITGLLAVSLMVGGTFWVMQRVVAPLLSI